jgi:hypothetical protein
VAPNPNYDNCTESGTCSLGPPCYGSSGAPQFTGTCEQEEVEAIDNARAEEGVGPMYLPSDFDSLSADEQLLVVIDLERVGRGLPPFAGIVASLDRVAQASVEGGGSIADPALPRGFKVANGTYFAYRCHSTGGGTYLCNGSGEPDSAIAAVGISALDADYGWMYGDGYGGDNGDCTRPHGNGCWGHRDNVLGRYPTHTRFIGRSWGSPASVVSSRRAVLVMGAGAEQPSSAGATEGNFTATFTSVVGRTPKFVYSWKQALAAGAGTAPT